MTWIATIDPADADGRLKRLYGRVAGPDGRIDNILTSHSLRPHTLDGHMSLYKNVLHHSGNNLPKWFLEAIGVYVSLLNGCAYCVDHHFAGLTRLLEDQERADAMLRAFRTGQLAPVFDGRERAAFDYAKTLTVRPHDVTEDMIVELRMVGYGDGEILEINQVTAYFAYANRTVLGLGVTTEGDTLGLSPNNSGDENDWSHS